MSKWCDDPPKTKKKDAVKRVSRWYTGRNAGYRHRGKPFMASTVTDWVVHQPEDGIIVLTEDSPVESSTFADEMWDTHGYLQNWYNPCVRETYRMGYEGPIDPISDPDGPLISFGTVTPQLRQKIRETMPFLNDAFLDELALQSEDKLSSVVDQEASIVNFILEAIESCHGNVKIVKRFQKLYAKGMIEYGKAFKRFLAQGHKHAAAAWLSWNFAIKPTLKDLRALLCSYNHTFRRLDWLRKHNHKVTYKTYSRDVTEHVTLPTEWIDAQDLCAITRAEPSGSEYPNGLYRLQFRYVSVKRARYCAKSKFHLDLPDYLVDGGKGFGAMWAALQGITNPVLIVWEAIPFSWLIDYFLSERARLFQRLYDFNPFNEGVHILGYGHSFDFEFVVESRVHNVTHDITHMTLGPSSYRLYSRRSGLPFPEQFTLLRTPGDLYHGSILTAFAVGFMPSRRR